MPRPLLPPRGYFVPTPLIFHSGLPAAVFLTLLQLRSLAWGKSETPSLPLQELLELTELSRTTLLRHLRLLEQRHLLRWGSPARGRIRVSFADDPNVPKMEPLPPPNFEQENAPKSAGQNMGGSKMVVVNLIQDPESFNDQNPPNLTLQQDESSSLPQKKKSLNLLKEGENRPHQLDKKHPEVNRINPDQVLRGKRECEGERGANLAAAGPHKNKAQQPVSHSALSVYTTLTGLYPTDPHAFALLGRVTDLPLWRSTLRHWLAQGHSARDIRAIFDLYSRSGEGEIEKYADDH